MLTKCIQIYQSSFLFFLTTKISMFIMRIWRSSFVRHIFYDEFGYARQVENSKIIRACRTAIANIQKRTVPFVQRSFFYHFFVDRLDHLTHYSMRSYAAMGIGFSFLGALLSFLLKSTQIPLMLYVAVFAVSIVLCLLKPSFAQLFNGSFWAKYIGRYFGLPSLKEKTVRKEYLLWVAIGGILGVMSAFLSVANFILFVGAAIGTLIILWKVEVGIFITIFLIPLISTKFIMGLCALTLCSYLVKLFFTGKAGFQFDLTDLFVFLFALLILYSVVISYVPSASFFMAFSYLLFISFYFVCKNTIKTKKQLFSMISLLVVSGLLVAAFGIFQRVTGRGFEMTESWIDTNMFSDNQIRVYSTLENPNVLGEYLLFVIPLALAGVYYFRNWMYKFFSFGIAMVALVTMILTLSRGAWLGLVVVAVLYTLIKDRRLIWLGLLLVLLAPIFLPPSIVERFMSIGDLSDTSSSYRLNILLASWNMLQDFWPIGIGLGTNVFVPIYQKFAFSAIYAPHSHNLFLQIAIELGIWGIIVFGLIIFTFWKNVLTQINRVKSSLYTSVSAALCAGMGGYLVQGLTDHVWYNYRIVAFFWVIVALSTILNRLMKEEIAHVNVQKI